MAIAKKKTAVKVDKKAELKAARAALKEATAEAKKAITALKVAAVTFVKAQGGDKDIMVDIKESVAFIKENISNLKASELKVED